MNAIVRMIKPASSIMEYREQGTKFPYFWWLLEADNPISAALEIVVALGFFFVVQPAYGYVYETITRLAHPVEANE